MRERYVEMPLEVEGMSDKLKAGPLPPPCRRWPTLDVLSWVDILVWNVDILPEEIEEEEEEEEAGRVAIRFWCSQRVAFSVFLSWEEDYN